MKDAKGLFLMLGGVALFIVVMGLVTQINQGKTNILSPYLQTKKTGASPTATSTGLSDLREITVGDVEIMVQMADTAAERQKGLGGVTVLPAGQGMLFDFGVKNISPQDAKFWMKDMKIPLDFIWIGGGKVVEITPNVPASPPNASDRELKIYEPSENIDYVLEVNAGFAAKNGIKVGDNVNL